jgi:putative sigma-54 modulation protein
MNLRITGHHVALTDALRRYVEHRFLDTLPRHFDRASCDLHVTLDDATCDTRHQLKECHVLLTVPGGRLVAREVAADFHVAVDLARHNLERQLDAYRERRLIGSRYPKKYFVAKLIEEERLPPVLEPLASEEEGAEPEIDRSKLPETD